MENMESNLPINRPSDINITQVNTSPITKHFIISTIVNAPPVTTSPNSVITQDDFTYTLLPEPDYSVLQTGMKFDCIKTILMYAGSPTSAYYYTRLKKNIDYAPEDNHFIISSIHIHQPLRNSSVPAASKVNKRSFYKENNIITRSDFIPEPLSSPDFSKLKPKMKFDSMTTIAVYVEGIKNDSTYVKLYNKLSYTKVRGACSYIEIIDTDALLQKPYSRTSSSSVPLYKTREAYFKGHNILTSKMVNMWPTFDIRRLQSGMLFDKMKTIGRYIGVEMPSNKWNKLLPYIDIEKVEMDGFYFLRIINVDYDIILDPETYKRKPRTVTKPYIRRKPLKPKVVKPKPVSPKVVKPKKPKPKVEKPKKEKKPKKVREKFPIYDENGNKIIRKRTPRKTSMTHMAMQILANDLYNKGKESDRYTYRQLYHLLTGERTEEVSEAQYYYLNCLFNYLKRSKQIEFKKKIEIIYTTENNADINLFESALHQEKLEWFEKYNASSLEEIWTKANGLSHMSLINRIKKLADYYGVGFVIIKREVKLLTDISFNIDVFKEHSDTYYSAIKNKLNSDLPPSYKPIYF